MNELVVHCKKDNYDVYIGRPTMWGNPFTHKKGTLARVELPTREAAVAAFEKWLRGEDYTDILQDRRRKILEELPTLKGKTLGCWCAPKACHGDVLARMAREGDR